MNIPWLALAIAGIAFLISSSLVTAGIAFVAAIVLTRLLGVALVAGVALLAAWRD